MKIKPKKKKDNINPLWVMAENAMKTKPKKATKKLSARARKKELTGINLAAMKKRLKYFETHYQVIFELLQGKYGCFPRINELEARVFKLERKK